jgi:hypothetical protein
VKVTHILSTSSILPSTFFRGSKVSDRIDSNCPFKYASGWETGLLVRAPSSHAASSAGLCFRRNKPEVSFRVMH